MHRFSRRQILLSGTASLGLFGARNVAAQPTSSNVLTLLLVVSGRPEEVEISAVREFLDRLLPIGIVPRDRTGGPSANWDVVAPYAGLVELVAPISDQPGGSRYAQMRDADDARRFLDGLELGPVPATGMLTDGRAEGVDIPAYRASGFRVMIALGDGSETRVGSVGRGQMLIDGGQMLDPGRDLVAQVRALFGTNGVAVAVLPIEPTVGGISGRVDALADWLASEARSGAIVMLRPMDHLLQSDQPVEQNLAVVIDAADAFETARAFADRLADLDVPSSLVVNDGALSGLADCFRVAPDDDPQTPKDTPGPTRCLFLETGALVPLRSSSDIVLRQATEGSSGTGLRGDARLHVATLPWRDALDPASPLVDTVAVLNRDDISSPQKQREIESALLDASFGDARLWPLTEWADHIVAPDILLERYRAARQRSMNTAPRALEPEETEAFLLDAETAWAYIAQNSFNRTGHAIPTLGTIPIRVPNQNATLWDVGSQIFGILSAAGLGLIDATERNDRIAKIVANIPLITIGGLRLPPAVFDVYQLTVQRVGFDVCDLGRFLLALDQAVAEGALQSEAVEDLWELWDVAETIRGGRLHSYRRGAWEDITVSHCTDYILPAFLRRGLSVTNIVPSARPGTSVADHDLAILSAAANAGPIGTEPSLLNLVEGAGDGSEVSWLLARLLHDAQATWFEAGNGLRSVSETPLDRAPWFTYQGLALEKRGDDAWTVNSIDPDPAFQTPEFRRDADVIGAKSAYLWRALVADDLSDRLVDLVRENCRTEGAGFSVGLYARSRQPMAGYFDINTNGIILSAIRRTLVNQRKGDGSL